jgi:rubrerythrin
MLLIKLSDPGWEIEFPTENHLKRYLYKYICNTCIDDDSITEKSSIDEMLSTACGCEFMVEEEKEYCPVCNAEWSGTSCGLNNCGWING